MEVLPKCGLRETAEWTSMIYLRYTWSDNTYHTRKRGKRRKKNSQITPAQQIGSSVFPTAWQNQWSPSQMSRGLALPPDWTPQCSLLSFSSHQDRKTQLQGTITGCFEGDFDFLCSAWLLKTSQCFNLKVDPGVFYPQVSFLISSVSLKQLTAILNTIGTHILEL